MKIISIVVVVLLVVLAWLVGTNALGREATAFALGAAMGALAVAPALLVIATGRQRIVYRDRIVYRVAEPVGVEPERTTSTTLAVYAPQMEVRS